MNKGINVTDSNISHQVQEDVSGLDSGSSINNPGKKCKNLTLNFVKVQLMSLDCIYIFSKVMGKDKDGCASMYGLGVQFRAADVWGPVPSRPACYRETLQWKATYESISNEVAEVKAMILEMRESNKNASCASSVPVTSEHRPKVATKPQSLKVGTEVYLKSIVISMEIVAKARVGSLDPDE